MRRASEPLAALCKARAVLPLRRSRICALDERPQRVERPASGGSSCTTERRVLRLAPWLADQNAANDTGLVHVWTGTAFNESVYGHHL
jgi:hypothetical protein